MKLGRLVGSVGAAVLLLGACGPVAPASVAPTPIPPELIAEAIKVRTEFGLRADEEWVLAVEANPAGSSNDFGVRLLPFERDELQARAKNSAELGPVVRGYGLQHVAEFGGVYVDPKTGVVVALFTTNVATHEAALRARLHPAARWNVRAVAFPEESLNALHERLDQDRAWFKEAGVHLGSSSIDIPENRVEVTYFSADPDAAVKLIADRYGAGEMLAAINDPEATFLLPRGSLRGRVVDMRGRPVADVLIEPRGDVRNAEPDGGVAIVTDADGFFLIPRLAEMGWEIRALKLVPGGDWRVVGTARAEVTEGTMASVVIEIDG
jgi:hypothetical protein